MRLLPIRQDHGRGRAVHAQAESDGRRDRRADARQHLPLQDLSAHRPRHRARRYGRAKAMTIQIGNSWIRHQQSAGAVSSLTLPGLTFAFTLGGGAWARRRSARRRRKRRNSTPGSASRPDDTITILCPRLRNGAGRVHLPAADPRGRTGTAAGRRSKTRFAPANPKVYGDPHGLFEGAQITAASISVPPQLFHAVAHGGAAGRARCCSMQQRRTRKVPVAKLTHQPGARSLIGSPRRAHRLPARS